MPILPGQTDSYYKSCFLSGLKSEIVNMVKMAKPHTLADTIEVAKLQEKNLEAIRRVQKPITQKYSSPQSTIGQGFPSQTKPKWTNDNSRRIGNAFQKGGRPGGHVADQYKKITPSEFSYRREKGLCFKCAEPYTLGHVCKLAQMQYILVD